MSTNPPTDERNAANDDSLERDVDAALVSLGWKVPQTEGEVGQAESQLTQLGGADDLPEALRDPQAVFDRPADHVEIHPEVIAFQPEPETEQELARAARQGSSIPPEIEEAMRRDREAAEQDMDDGPQDA